jgi:hypothetical protein
MLPHEHGTDSQTDERILNAFANLPDTERAEVFAFLKEKTGLDFDAVPSADDAKRLDAIEKARADVETLATKLRETDPREPFRYRVVDRYTTALLNLDRLRGER